MPSIRIAERRHLDYLEHSFRQPWEWRSVLLELANPLQAYVTAGHSPCTEQYSFDVQQQLRPGMVLDIGYCGNHGVHLFSTIDLNQPLAGAYLTGTKINPGGVNGGNTPVLNLVRPYQGYSNINFSSTQFFSKYSGLQTSLRQQYKNVVQMTVNYTWAKALTNNRTPQDNQNLAAEYGAPANFRRHVFNANFVYPLPFFRRQRTLVGKIAGGFQISGIVTYGSGQYDTTTIGASDPGGRALLVGPATARPDQLADPNTNAPHTSGSGSTRPPLPLCRRVNSAPATRASATSWTRVMASGISP